MKYFTIVDKNNKVYYFDSPFKDGYVIYLYKTREKEKKRKREKEKTQVHINKLKEIENKENNKFIVKEV